MTTNMTTIGQDVLTAAFEAALLNVIELLFVYLITMTVNVVYDTRDEACLPA